MITAQFLHDYWAVQLDPAHLLSEFGFELAQLAAVALLWRRFLRPRFFRRLHDDLDAEHGVTHNNTESEVTRVTEQLLASVVLDRAADQIAKTGLEKFAFRSGQLPVSDQHRFCLIGAVYFVKGGYTRYGLDYLDGMNDPLFDYVLPLIGGGSLDVVRDWSDAESTTAGMVVDVLRHAASVARFDEAA